MERIEKVAVLGAGVMGGTIAAHLANAGLEVLLLDVVSRDAAPAAAGTGARPAGPGRGEAGRVEAGGPGAARSRVAAAGLEAVIAAKPAALFVPALAARIQVGNFEDDAKRLRECDWVLEVVIEDLAVKKRLLADTVAPNLRPGAILSTNTSGLSVNELAEALPGPLRSRFLVTHFFNPPRYMRLLEIVPSRHTDAAVVAGMAEFLARRLGKGIVFAKDTPNFVANRIGVYAICSAMRHMVELGLTVEEVDAVAGPATARPRSAAFGTADLVGLDTLRHVARNSWELLPGDDERDVFRLPAFVDAMVEKGLLGNKARRGFYRKEKGEGGSRRFFYDHRSGEYVECRKPRFASVEAARSIDDPGNRLDAVLAARDPAAELAWRSLRDTLLYAFKRLPEIADDVVNVDNAMRWGFSWELGPFEMLDAIGVRRFVERARGDGARVPAGLERIERFYRTQGDRRQLHRVAEGGWQDVPRPPRAVDLALLKRSGGLVERSAGASIVDLGDGVLGLEFHTKMNAIGGDALSMAQRAAKRAEAEGVGLVIANQGAAFSAGANLALLAAGIAEGDWDEIALMVKSFQRATLALKRARVPVVAAPHGLALGGGCEICLHSSAMNPHAETYMGLVEVGVGLLPAGGGTKELALRAAAIAERYDTDPSPFVFDAFRTIATARVSASAAELPAMGFMRHGDAFTMSLDDLVHDAKRKVLALAVNYRPPPPGETRAPGRSVAATLRTQLWNMRQGGFISEYDEHVGRTVAHVLTGGDVPQGTPITEEYLLELEREAFLSLCGERRTVERIQHMLKKGKPLRN